MRKIKDDLQMEKFWLSGKSVVLALSFPLLVSGDWYIGDPASWWLFAPSLLVTLAALPVIRYLARNMGAALNKELDILRETIIRDEVA